MVIVEKEKNRETTMARERLLIETVPKKLLTN
jgi:hypothetical protein